MSKHTELPWKVSGFARITGPHPKGDGRVRHIATAIHDNGTYRQEQEANACHIVHCVNNHDRLLDMLHAFIDNSSCQAAMPFECERAEKLLAQLDTKGEE